MAINKVIYGGKTLIDLTGDTVTSDKMLNGCTSHDKSGIVITGSCSFDVNSADATVTNAEMLNSKTGYARGVKLVGTMPNNAAMTGSITTKEQKITIAQGYHDGGGKVAIDATEQSKIIAGNIKQGITVLGILGTLEPSSSVTAHPKSVIPTTTEQIILPDVAYDYLSQVTVAAIPYVESANAAGGVTATIAG